MDLKDHVTMGNNVLGVGNHGDDINKTLNYGYFNTTKSNVLDIFYLATFYNTYKIGKYVSTYYLLDLNKKGDELWESIPFTILSLKYMCIWLATIIITGVYLSRYYYPVLVCVGIIGNTLSFLVSKSAVHRPDIDIC